MKLKSFQVCALLLVYASHSSFKESQLVGKKTYQLLMELPLENELIQLKNELKILSDICNNSSTVFTAFGFFNIDYTLFLNLTQSFTSYLIVIIQLHKD